MNVTQSGCELDRGLRGRCVNAAELLSWIALAALLALGLPLFLCMPLVSDVTLYDLAARNILRGGVHYRDIFDTNLPGMVWLHAGIRAILGWRSEALRACDFAILSGIVYLLTEWLRELGVTRVKRIWTAFALYAFYLGTTEWCHCQRDVWMLLPALIALRMRRRQAIRLISIGGTTGRAVAFWAASEGLFWGAAFWVKPFVAIPAMICWTLTTARTRRAPGKRFGLVLMDGLGLLSGGLVAGALGTAWLMASGAWPYFWNVFLEWNPDYVKTSYSQLSIWMRFLYPLLRLWPWGLIAIVGIPVAVAAAGRLILSSGKTKDVNSQTVAIQLGIFAGFYLGWISQAVLLQVPWDYALAPQILLGICLLVGRGWPVNGTLWGNMTLALFVVLAAVRHPLTDSGRLALWAGTWRDGSSSSMRDHLKLEPDFAWEDLVQVTGYLRSLGPRDGEITCYNNATQPIYLDLDVRPSTRFLQFDTVLRLLPAHRETVRQELAASQQRYVVSDLRAAHLTPLQIDDWLKSGSLLPRGLAAGWENRFPWSEPVVFKNRRYAVHKVTGPVGVLSFESDTRSSKPGTE